MLCVPRGLQQTPSTGSLASCCAPVLSRPARSSLALTAGACGVSGLVRKAPGQGFRHSSHVGGPLSAETVLTSRACARPCVHRAPGHYIRGHEPTGSWASRGEVGPGPPRLNEVAARSQSPPGSFLATCLCVPAKRPRPQALGGGLWTQDGARPTGRGRGGWQGAGSRVGRWSCLKFSDTEPPGS